MGCLKLRQNQDKWHAKAYTCVLKWFYRVKAYFLSEMIYDWVVFSCLFKMQYYQERSENRVTRNIYEHKLCFQSQKATEIREKRCPLPFLLILGEIAENYYPCLIEMPF